SRRRRWRVLACPAFVLAIVAPAALVWSALYPTSVLQFVIGHIPHRMGGMQRDIVGVSGTVAEGVRVERVEIDHDLVHLKFEGIEGQVALMPLVLQTIRVRHGTVRSALIQVKRRTHPSPPGPLVFMPRWPLGTAEQGRVASATLTVYNGFRLQATGIESAAV